MYDASFSENPSDINLDEPKCKANTVHFLVIKRTFLSSLIVCVNDCKARGYSLGGMRAKPNMNLGKLGLSFEIGSSRSSL